MRSPAQHRKTPRPEVCNRMHQVMSLYFRLLAKGLPVSPAGHEASRTAERFCARGTVNPGGCYAHLTATEEASADA
jgi:hypothetical protein